MTIGKSNAKNCFLGYLVRGVGFDAAASGFPLLLDMDRKAGLGNVELGWATVDICEK